MIKSSSTATPSFGDFLVNPKNMETRKKEFFENLEKIINWNPIIYRIEKLYNKEFGRPAFAALMMFKSLLLAQWYGLNDVELEDCLKDRISFKKFVGLKMEDNVPDETTIGRFRKLLTRKRLQEKLFEIINKQLEEKEIFIKKGTLIDASILESDGGRRKTRDKDATWVKKNNKSYFGYKAHAGMDQGSGLIHSLEATTASTHDSQIWDELLHGKEKAEFADKGYYDEGYKQLLRKNRKFCGIMDKAKKNHKLSKRQKKLNGIKARLRAPVERFFAVIKRQYKFIRIRYRGLENNRQHLFALGIAFNLERAVSLLCT